MNYELVKYRYGRGGYTALCLTPKLPKARVSVVHGIKLTGTNEGVSSPRAQHFQHPETAQAWMKANGAVVSKPDWLPLEKSSFWPVKASAA